ncbi:MAG: hypothetical protein IPP19_13260 [Verrucomicrobia bacterium]|nr:hypothetical protein [Verrucomicrobiota bacterium]
MIFPVVAFVTAACVYGSFAYFGIRMKRSQVDRLANLPFNEEIPTRHETVLK